MDIRAYWQAALNQNPEAMRLFFHPDAVIRWHATGEQFTLEAFLQANCSYPGKWQGTVQRCVAHGDEVETITLVQGVDTPQAAYAVSIFRIRDGLIASLDEYWADVTLPPPWRAGLGSPIVHDPVS